METAWEMTTVTRQRATFGKMQRERDKQAKAKAKRDRRSQAAVDPAPEPEESAGPQHKQHESAEELLEMIAEVHRQHANDEISFEDYEARKAELLGRLPIE